MVQGDDFVAENLTFENSLGQGGAGAGDLRPRRSTDLQQLPVSRLAGHAAIGIGPPLLSTTCTSKAALTSSMAKGRRISRTRRCSPNRTAISPPRHAKTAAETNGYVFQEFDDHRLGREWQCLSGPTVAGVFAGSLHRQQDGAASPRGGLVDVVGDQQSSDGVLRRVQQHGFDRQSAQCFAARELVAPIDGGPRPRRSARRTGWPGAMAGIR